MLLDSLCLRRDYSKLRNVKRYREDAASSNRDLLCGRGTSFPNSPYAPCAAPAVRGRLRIPSQLSSVSFTTSATTGSPASTSV